MKNNYTPDFNIFSLSLLCVALTFTLFWSQTAYSQCLTGTVAHYKLDEADGATTFTDFANGLNGTCVAAVNCPTATDGIIDGAQQFNGTDQYIEVPYTSQFDFAGSFSVEVWVRFNTTSAGNRVFVTRNNNDDEGSNQGMYWWVGVDNSNRAIFKVRDNSSPLVHEVVGTTALNDNNYHQVVAVHDAAADQIRIFVDGAQQGFFDIAMNGDFVASAGKTLRIGSFRFSDVSADEAFFDGAIDNVGIYNRALCDASCGTNEILVNFNNTQAGTSICPSAPAITSTAPTSATIGEAYSYQVEATGDPVPTYSLTVSPGGMDIDENTGLITWVPQQVDAGDANVTVRATNSQGNDEQLFTITVGQENDPPSFDNEGDVVVDEDSGPQSITGWATNIDDGDAELEQVLTFTITENTNEALFAEGPAISAEGELTFTPADNANGVANITVTLDDDGSPSQSSDPVTFSITVNAINDAPEFTLSETDVVRDLDFSPIIIDVIPGPVPADEAGQSVIYTLEPETVDFAELAISPISGTVTITAPSSGVAGSQEFVVTANDNQAENNIFTQTFTLTVNGPIGIGDSEFAKSLSVFPIPGSDQVTLRMENDYLGAVKVKIFDMRGKMVKGFDQIKNTLQYQQQIDVADIRSGTYFVHVILGSDIILEKLLKN